MIQGTLEMRFTTATTCAILSSICLVSAPASARGNLRAEAVIGWDNVSNSGSAFAVNLSDFTKVNGLTYGGGIGYDLAVMPMISIGADAEINGSSGRREAGPAYLRADRDIYAGGRVSVKVLPSTKIYAKLGYANADFTNNASFALHGPAIFFTEKRNVSGIRAGVGIQQTILGPAYVLAEYRYTNYSSGFARNQVVTGVGVRF